MPRSMASWSRKSNRNLMAGGTLAVPRLAYTAEAPCGEVWREMLKTDSTKSLTKV